MSIINNNTEFTPEMLINIKNQLDAGEQALLADEFGVPKQYVSAILNGNRGRAVKLGKKESKAYKIVKLACKIIEDRTVITTFRSLSSAFGSEDGFCPDILVDIDDFICTIRMKYFPISA